MKRFKRVMKKIGKGILILIIALAVVHSIASYVLGRRLEAKIAEIKAQGDPISTLNLGKNTVPDSENAAGIYLKIFEKIGYPIIYQNGAPRFRRGGLDLGPYGYWHSLYITENDGERTPEMWESARRSLTAYPSISVLIDKAISMPNCQFPMNWKDGPLVTLPHYASIGKLSELLYTRALVNAHYGDMDSAVKDVSRILGISRSIRNEPVMAGQAIRYGIIRNGTRCIQYMLRCGLDDRQIRLLEDALADGDMHEGYVVGIKGERALSITSFRILIAGRNVFMWAPDNLIPLHLRVRPLIYIWRPLLYVDMMKSMDSLSHHIDEAEAPILHRMKTYSGQEKSAGYTLLADWWPDMLSGSQSSRDVCETRILSCRTMLNLMRYKHRFGAYPESLDVLRSKLNVDVPVDPMSGKDFVYKRQGDGFLLHSIGANMRDDGGKSVASPHETEPDDIVWSMTK